MSKSSGWGSGDNSKQTLKNLPRHIKLEHTRRLLEIVNGVTEAVCCVVSLCRPTPCLLKKITNEDAVVVELHKNKHNYFVIQIYVKGCNIYWTITCNTQEKPKALKLIRDWRALNGLSKK